MFKTIFLKEMKDVLRDKRSITLLIVLPLVMMSTLTFFYEKMLSMHDDNTEFTLAIEPNLDSTFVTQLETLIPDANIKKTNEMKQAVEEKEVQIGLKVAPEWKKQFEQQIPIDIEMIYDPGSQESSGALNVIMSALSQWQTQETQVRLADKEIPTEVIQVFNMKEVPTKNEDDAIASYMLAFLLPLLIPMAIANGSYPAATELFAGEKEKKTMEALLIAPVKPIKILLAKWLTISLLGIFTGLLCLVIIGIEINFTTELKKGIETIPNLGTFIGMSAVLIILFAIFITEIEMTLSMLANSVKEAGYYITPVVGCMTFPLLVITFIEESLNLKLYAIPVLNLFLFVRDSFNDQMTFTAFAVAVASYLILIVLIFPIANKLFHNHKLMIGK
ncbi:ABC transporter permease [Bacillus sp. Hm123]|uniref:ABC transporter permease n=1 Tax=Bacillus sp. Hm123 TaxID=3450745 RepID=UPI003F437EBD